MLGYRRLPEQEIEKKKYSERAIFSMIALASVTPVSGDGTGNISSLRW
jgi:hypothetical protein